MTLTKAHWPPFPRPYWPQCSGSLASETDDCRRLRCCACGQSAERALPAKLKIGEEACAAIERAERLMAQLAVIGFRAELDAHGALSFVNAKPERRDFARMCPAAYCFAVVNAALDIDPGFVAAAVSRPSKKQRIARAGRDRWGALKPAICRKARQLLLGRWLPPVPHYAHSCRFFEANPSPPEPMK
jgi:hypothetical protein